MSEGVSNDRPVQPPPPPPPEPKVNEAAASEKVGADKAASEGAQQAQQQTRAMEPAKVEGTAAVQQSAGEKFSQFQTGQAGQVGQAAAASNDPAGPSLAPRTSQRSEAAKAEAQPAKSTEEVRKEATQKQLDTAADKLAKDSPTAKALLDKFRAEGGKLEDGGKSGYFKDGKPPTIGIPTQTSLGTQTSEQQRQQTIAHELGHLDHARSNPPAAVQPQNNGKGKTDAAIEAGRERDYVVKNAERHLADEAHATQVNDKIRNEVKAKTGQDIGVAGVRPGDKVPSKQELIDQYGRLNPSTQPDKTYREYYNQPYLDHYKQNFTPGAPGNVR